MHRIFGDQGPPATEDFDSHSHLARAAYDVDGRLTGALDGDNCYGECKLRQVERYLAEDAAGLPVICYSDHHADLPLLRFATEPVAVNPSRRLRRVALSQGITIADWNR